MFKITDNAIAPRKEAFDNARKRLPEAHRQAHRSTVVQLHQHLVQVAEDEGLDSSPLVISWKKQTPYIGITRGEKGDALFESEYGKPDEAPNPVLRTAARAVKPQMDRHYNTALRQGLGF